MLLVFQEFGQFIFKVHTKFRLSTAFQSRRCGITARFTSHNYAKFSKIRIIGQFFPQISHLSRPSTISSSLKELEKGIEKIQVPPQVDFLQTVNFACSILITSSRVKCTLYLWMGCGSMELIGSAYETKMEKRMDSSCFAPKIRISDKKCETHSWWGGFNSNWHRKILVVFLWDKLQNVDKSAQTFLQHN